jgi:hypothetical protein
MALVTDWSFEDLSVATDGRDTDTTVKQVRGGNEGKRVPTREGRGVALLCALACHSNRTLTWL